jgi:translation initiation factor 3 subunit E
MAATNYELSSKLVQYLDLHLTLPIMEYLQERGLYNEDDILRGKLALLEKTNMVRAPEPAEALDLELW